MCVCITVCVCVCNVCASTSDVRAPKTEVNLRFSMFGCVTLFLCELDELVYVCRSQGQRLPQHTCVCVLSVVCVFFLCACVCVCLMCVCVLSVCPVFKIMCVCVSEYTCLSLRVCVPV